MPLRCVDPKSGKSVQSFDLTDREWEALVDENKGLRHLKMPCCDASVTLKKSRLGTRFFAHKARGACESAPETEAHLALKSMAVAAAKACGWSAETEVGGITPSGEEWRADVFARKGNGKVAVEIQWSGQTNEETLRRQRRYKDAGVRGLWLLRQPGFPISHELPAVCIGGSLDEGFVALIPYYAGMSARNRNKQSGWHQIVPMERFLTAAFDGRLRYGVPLGVEAEISVRSAIVECWHEACRARTRILTGIDVAYGPNKHEFSLDALGQHPELLQSILSKLPNDPMRGEIKRRYSRTIGEKYMSNGCVRCDRLQGAFFGIYARNDEDVQYRFPLRIDVRWKNAIENGDSYGPEPTWWVFHGSADNKN